MEKILGQELGPKLVCFCHFLKFGLLVFLEIAYNDNMQQYITSSRSKTYKKYFWDQTWAKTGENQAQN